jgi:hypothetical protein
MRVTICIWVLVEKKLLQEISTFYGAREFIDVFTKALHWALS